MGPLGDQDFRMMNFILQALMTFEDMSGRYLVFQSLRNGERK